MRIKRIELQGFRSFGRSKQEIAFSGPLSIVYGHNSQGKTSLAEAIEFLLTGAIVRRELSASSQDEFADSLAHDGEAHDCPLCAAQGTLTADRISFIRTQVESTGAFIESSRAAAELLRTLQARLSTIGERARASLPAYLSWGRALRHERNFTMARIRSLLGDDDGLLENWTPSLRRLVSRYGALVAALVRAGECAAVIDLRTVKPSALDDLRTKLLDVEKNLEAFSAMHETHSALESDLHTTLLGRVDQESDTVGWSELLELGAHLPALRLALIDVYAHKRTVDDLAGALRQIDRANEKVLEGKFKGLSASIDEWWSRLRPDEMSFFTAVQPRPNARRTIDFKAGLSAKPDRSDPKLRDVIAVFSQSQLHCLGLALFLARTIHDKGGFIVLDDPILSSDDDYRAHFNTSVLEHLTELGIQVILLTQDQRTAKDLQDRYIHLGVDSIELTLTNPVDGTVATNMADDLGSMLNRSEILIRGGHRELQKQAGEVLRDAGERFCKEVLVRNRRQKGDAGASLLDYDEKNLGQLTPLVEPLLTADPADPGKLRAVGRDTNPANHDDNVPPAGTLKVVLGDLRKLRSGYLR